MTATHVQPRELAGLEEIAFDPARLGDDGWVSEISDALRQRYGFIVKNVVAPNVLDRIVDYLRGIGRHSLPSYEPLVEGCRDSHRVSYADPRSYVTSVSHQFYFHPWNHNVFDLFSLMRPVFVMKNRFGGFEAEQFLTNTPRDPFIARCAFLHYPRGGGFMATHSDPVGEHQLAVPVLQLSDKGRDYQSGGAFAIGAGGEVIDVDARLQKGDVFFMNGEVMHGVAPVDAEEPLDWLSFRGRWVMLGAIIKTVANTTSPNALQVGT